MESFKFIQKNFDGKTVSEQEIRKMGIKNNSFRMVDTLDEILEYPPNIVIAECVKPRSFAQDKFKTQNLKKKSKYVMNVGVYQQLYFDVQTKQKVLKPYSVKFSKIYKPYKGQDLTDKTLLVMRTGGIGDLLFIQPNLNYLKEIYPSCTIHLACGPQYHAMLESWDCLDKIIDLPAPFQYVIKANYHAIFEGVIERCTLAHTKSAYRLFTKWLKLNLPDDKLIPIQKVNKEKKQTCLEILSDWNVDPHKFICIQMRASSPIRTPRPSFWKNVINKLTDLGYKVVLIDMPAMSEQLDNFIDSLKNDRDVFNFSHYSTTLDYSIAMASLSKLVISTDSSFIHIAAALRVPGFAFYGPFPGAIRLSTYKNIEWVDAKATCAPCFSHGPNPCKNSIEGHSVCYDNIDIDECINRIERLLENGNKNSNDCEESSLDN